MHLSTLQGGEDAGGLRGGAVLALVGEGGVVDGTGCDVPVQGHLLAPAERPEDVGCIRGWRTCMDRWTCKGIKTTSDGKSMHIFYLSKSTTLLSKPNLQIYSES